MAIGNLRKIHQNFVMKKNPYISDELAQNTYSTLVMAETATATSLLCFMMSLFKIFPRLSLRVAFKKATVAQFGVSLVLYGYYCYKLNRLKELIPQYELEQR